MGGWTLRSQGDSALAVELEQVIDPLVSARVVAIGDRLRREQHQGVRDVIEGYCSVTIVFDPLRTDIGRLRSAVSAAADEERGASDDGPEVTLPVCYGGRFGPDLAAVAARSGCTEDQVVTVHSGATYRVYCLGFLPGFAYLGSVPEQIVGPRRSSPRLRVPAGAVGIAGRQTGVYPLEAPGGWQLIGRCPVKMFDPLRSDPFRLHVGDRVRFKAVAEAEYAQVGRMGPS